MSRAALSTFLSQYWTWLAWFCADLVPAAAVSVNSYVHQSYCIWKTPFHWCHPSLQLQQSLYHFFLIVLPTSKVSHALCIVEMWVCVLIPKTRKNVSDVGWVRHSLFCVSSQGGNGDSLWECVSAGQGLTQRNGDELEGKAERLSRKKLIGYTKRQSPQGKE